MLVTVDLGTEAPLAVGYINEYSPQAVRRWLEPLVQRHGITVIVTDDLSSYKIVVERLQTRASGLSIPCPSLGGENAQAITTIYPKRLAVGLGRNPASARSLATRYQ